MRNQLRPLKHKTVIVTGYVTDYVLRYSSTSNNNYIRNLRILLTHVYINGIFVSHIWLIERRRLLNDVETLMNEKVKFKAKVVCYVKIGERGMVEDYGIERKTRLVHADHYQVKYD